MTAKSARLLALKKYNKIILMDTLLPFRYQTSSVHVLNSAAVKSELGLKRYVCNGRKRTEPVRA